MENESGNCSVEEKTKTVNWVKPLLIVAGSVFFGLGILGIILPVLPTTPFLLLAAACYARSSQRFYCWLLNNRWFGTYIDNYRRKKGMPLKVKLLTVSLMWITLTLSLVFAVQSLTLRLILIILALGVSIHILRIKTLKQ
jgi:uncharacterized membrane protein YbaN (DUF454 family)